MTNKTLARRDFLKTAGLTLAAATVTCSGLGYAATRTPDLETPELIFEKEHIMKNRILVSYATRAGATVEVAAAIGESLSPRGFTVEVKPMKENPNPADYQAVILGSAIRMGGWLPEAVDFIKRNQQALIKIPTALFTVHMLNTGDDETSRINRLAYLNLVRPFLDNVEEIYFAGKMDFSRLSFLDRFVAGMVKAVETDQRDWDKIRSWSPAILV
jgi:menaquinone-dependent protoporphyrinogen oxidase